MWPLNQCYKAADKKLFDVYHISAAGSTGLGKLLQSLHTGLLPLYVFFIVVGVLIFLVVI
ncbi:MAG: hypothetical protein U5R06_22115 [candidate division KSB1 bacterium]|nr:hypothetical protein [candidate division KSB1 bacterium]